MGGPIEKMNRIRKKFLFVVLIGTSIAFCFLIYPSLYSIFHNAPRFIFKLSNRFFDVAVILWFLTSIFFLTQFWMYKVKLKKNPHVKWAVYDE